MTTKSRRRVLKGLGMVLPAAWVRPVVETVVLPAHAEMSTVAESVYSLICSIEDITDYTVTPEDGDFQIDFSYTPIDSSGTLNGQPVHTIYTAYDADGTVIFGPWDVTAHSLFGDQLSVSLGVGPPMPPGPYTVMVIFGDQATYGTASCASSGSPPSP